MADETILIEDYVDIEEKSAQLNCNVPTSISLLPRNFDRATSKDELIHEGTTATIRKLFSQNHIQETSVEKEGEKYPQVVENAFDWVGPTILITSSVIIQNPHLITITLNVISNYLTDFFKGIPNNQTNAKLSIVVKNKSGNYKKIKYNGHKDGLKELPEIIKAVHDEQQ